MTSLPGPLKGPLAMPSEADLKDSLKGNNLKLKFPVLDHRTKLLRHADGSAGVNNMIDLNNIYGTWVLLGAVTCGFGVCLPQVFCGISPCRIARQY